MGQLLTKAIVLFVLGGILGVPLGLVLLRMFVRLAPPTLSRLRDVSLDGSMLAIALGMAALTACSSQLDSRKPWITSSSSIACSNARAHYLASPGVAAGSTILRPSNSVSFAIEGRPEMA